MDARPTPGTNTNSASPFRCSGGSSTSDGSLEAIRETMFAVAIATAVCVGLANLAVHVNEARAARTAGIASGQRVDLGARLSSGFAPVVSQSASRSDPEPISQRPDRT
jgi:hypothetical protein